MGRGKPVHTEEGAEGGGGEGIPVVTRFTKFKRRARVARRVRARSRSNRSLGLNQQALVELTTSHPSISHGGKAWRPYTVGRDRDGLVFLVRRPRHRLLKALVNDGFPALLSLILSQKASSTPTTTVFAYWN
jgi:hypothetical protein